ncbi:hypothetical protein DYB30_011028 [Aphanomyces astaci]|uniref:Elongin-C n=3 Tax=Aphanomyces astaci TaxID=112090 RepID=A0A397E098_APHAT|nr:hypothetical protein DYB30_011028 [Aphanomyces astaci]RHY70387.1 hypothetical protein DYB38_010053 [Aphanomyces astaci]
MDYRKSKHTIILVQYTEDPNSRTYLDFESVNSAMDGVVKMYEAKLKQLNPNRRNITYDIQDLYNYIDSLADLSTLVMADASSDPAGQQEYIKLISAEGHEFYIARKCAMVSGTIKAMLTGHFIESKGEIRFQDIGASILEKVIQYMYYKKRYSNSNARIPDFVIEPEIALELLMAANYLDC